MFLGYKKRQVPKLLSGPVEKGKREQNKSSSAGGINSAAHSMRQIIALIMP
jgi:hypothetical protein